MEKPNHSPFETQVQDLTWREQEILSLLGKRLSDKEIGAQLHLAVNTVKWYNRQIFSKLSVANRKQAAILATQLKQLPTREKFSGDEGSHSMNNLPAQLSSFVGRNKEIADIVNLLKSSRLITITGAGGSGKTRLALQVVEELINSYKDGVWLVELAEITNPFELLIEIARVLKLNARDDIKLVEILNRYLEEKHILLVLDNFEHLDEAAPLLSELLAASPQLTVLVTSRSRLNIYGEQEYSLRPLNLPDLDNHESSELLLQYEAVDLFIKRAKLAQTELFLDKDDIKAVAKICVMLDGLPLALELAAPLVKIYGFTQLAQHLEKDLEALPIGPRDIPERQRTLRATMEWSYQLLEEDDKILFDRLSIFAGGSTLDAVESICADGLSGKVVDRLTSLVGNNLLFPIETTDGELHFTMLGTIRQFSQVNLVARSDGGKINRKHAAYFADLAELSLAEIRGKRNRYWFIRLGVENKNMHSALAWSLEGDEPEFGFRMVGPLSYYWYYNGFGREIKPWINLAIEKSVSAEPVLRANVLLPAGILAYNLSEHEKSRELLLGALEIFRDIEDKLSEGVALVHLSMASLRSPKNPDDAHSLVLEGLDIFRSFENKAFMALAYDILGEVNHFQGDYSAAKRHFQKSLDLAKETGEVQREAALQAKLGVIAFREADYKTSYQRNKEGLSLSIELPSSFRLATQLALLAGPIAALGFPKRAATLLGAAAAAIGNMGDDQRPAIQPEIDEYTYITQRAMGEKAFRETWQKGQRMTVQEAAAYALSDKDS